MILSLANGHNVQQIDLRLIDYDYKMRFFSVQSLGRLYDTSNIIQENGSVVLVARGASSLSVRLLSSKAAELFILISCHSRVTLHG